MAELILNKKGKGVGTENIANVFFYSNVESACEASDTSMKLTLVWIRWLQSWAPAKNRIPWTGTQRDKYIWKYFLVLTLTKCFKVVDIRIIIRMLSNGRFRLSICEDIQNLRINKESFGYSSLIFQTFQCLLIRSS